MKKILGIVAGREKGEKNRPFLRGQKGKIKYIDNISPL